jgi:hypothetical protein
MSVYTPSYQVEWMGPGGTWLTIGIWVPPGPSGDSLVLGLSVEHATEGNAENPVFLGDSSMSRARVKLRDLLTFVGEEWADRRIRIRQRMLGATLRTVFEGIITNRRIDLAADTVEYNCAGYADLVKRSKAITDLRIWRRAATETTATSIEDPSHPDYAGGLINEALFRAGFRPLEQDTNPAYIAAARGWYSLDNALFIPKHSWLAGENTWAECAELARSCGGQMYQDQNGVIRFRSPFTPTQGLVSLTWTEDDYANIQEDQGTGATVTSVRVPWMLRAEQVPYAAFELAEPVIVPAKGVNQYGILDLPVVMPIARWDDIPFVVNGYKATLSGLSEENFVVSDFSHTRILPTPGQAVFVQAMELGAQWLQLRIHHTYDKPLVVNRLVLNATPIAVIAQGEVVVGSGTSQFKFKPSVYISDEAHARQLAEMLLAFFSEPRPKRTITGLLYDERRYIGERIRVSSARLGLSSVVHVITAIRPKDSALMDVDCVPVDDLPQFDQLFVIGESYSPSAVRQVVW